jgi:hypothetical protein
MVDIFGNFNIECCSSCLEKKPTIEIAARFPCAKVREKAANPLMHQPKISLPDLKIEWSIRRAKTDDLFTCPDNFRDAGHCRLSMEIGAPGG